MTATVTRRNPGPTLLSRDKLIAACDEIIENGRDAHMHAWERYATARARERDRWVERWNPEWSDALTAIKRAIKNGTPITAKMLPGKSTSAEVFSEGYHAIDDNGVRVEKPAREEYAPPHEIVTLKMALHVHQEETITPNGLEALGVTRTALRDAVQIMGRHEAQKDA